jgi:hypothetical protein
MTIMQLPATDEDGGTASLSSSISSSIIIIIVINICTFSTLVSYRDALTCVDKGRLT